MRPASQEAESPTGSSDDWEDAIGDGLTDWRVKAAEKTGRPRGWRRDWLYQPAGPSAGADAGLHLSPRDRAWLEILIEALDEDGYVRDPLTELAEGFAEVFESDLGGALDEDEMMVGLRLLQALDPPASARRACSNACRFSSMGSARSVWMR